MEISAEMSLRNPIIHATGCPGNRMESSPEPRGNGAKPGVAAKPEAGRESLSKRH